MAPHQALEPPTPHDPTFYRYISRSIYDSFWRRSQIVVDTTLFTMIFCDLIGHPQWGMATAVIVSLSLTAVLMAEVLGY